MQTSEIYHGLFRYVGLKTEAWKKTTRFDIYPSQKTMDYIYNDILC